jgi:hypothetical protein
MDSWREILGEEEGLKVEEAMEPAWNVSLERGEQRTGYGRLEAALVAGPQLAGNP